MGFFGDVFDVVGSVVGSVIGGPVGVISNIVGGLLGGNGDGQAAVPVTPGMEMGQLSQISALGVPAATGGVTGLSTLTSAIETGVGIYGQLAQLEIAEGMTEAEKIKAQTKLMEAEALKIYAATPAAAPATARIPTLASQPVYVTPAVSPAAPNYLLYAGLAILVIFLFRKK